MLLKQAFLPFQARMKGLPIQPFFVMSFLEIGSHKLFARADFEWSSS
jgi:hypothetical protein